MNQAMTLYFDHMASTPCHPDVIQAMTTILQSIQDSANPSSQHPYGKQAMAKIQTLEAAFLKSIGATNGEVVWTSGATEAINLALLGTCRQYRHAGKHIISLQTEHSATLETLKQLEKEGFEVTLLPVKKDGLIDPASIREAFREDTLLCTIMHVHNEIGVIQDIEQIAEACDKNGILLHVDCAQSLGKANIKMHQGITLASFSAHKCYGPKGIGALYINTNAKRKLQKVQYGGSQQNNHRAGTLPLFLIAGMTQAAKHAQENYEKDYARYLRWQQKIQERLKNKVTWNGCMTMRCAQNCHISLPATVHLNALEALKAQFQLSSHSACQIMPESHVLTALGMDNFQQVRTIRIGFGQCNKEDDVDALILAICELLES